MWICAYMYVCVCEGGRVVGCGCAYLYGTVCDCICLPLPSNQSFYRLIAGYWMSGGDHEVLMQGVKGGHVTIVCVCVCVFVGSY